MRLTPHEGACFIVKEHRLITFWVLKMKQTYRGRTFFLETPVRQSKSEPILLPEAL